MLEFNLRLFFSNGGNMNAIVLILSEARGIYIPRDFICAKSYEISWEHCAAWGLTKDNAEQWQDAANPENEWYWDAWDWVLNNAEFKAENGDKYRLHQDGDLWGICYDKMIDEEKRIFGFED